jgi:amidase
MSIHELSAVELASAIRERSVSCREAVEAYLDRIQRHNPALNAVVTVDAERARARAIEADRAIERGESWGPLHGVAITVKDAFETAGVRTTAGYPPFAQHVPTSDAPVVARLLRAGAILLGKTNLPPLASGNQTTNPIFGRTNNPWDLARTPGGSSGGSAVAIAAGLSALELGSDVGGSIRGPAHLCGIYGLKPTGGRLPLAGTLSSPRASGSAPLGQVMLQFPVYGPLARSVADLRLAFAVLDDAWSPEVAARSVPPADRMRVAWTDDLGGTPIMPEIRQAIARAAERLATAGSLVERQPSPGFDYADCWDATGRCIGAFETARSPRARRMLFRLGGPLLARAMGGGELAKAFFAGARMGDASLRNVVARREALIASVDAFLARWDAWMCPVMPVVAYPHCRPGTTLRVDGRKVAETFMDLTFSGPFNLTGHPVVVLPVGHSSDGFPIGAQLVGRRGGEAELLDAAEAVDRVLGEYRRPPAHAS